MANRLCEVALPVRTVRSTVLDVWTLFCQTPATAVHRYACVHEHVSERATCAEHSPQPDIVGCRQCFEVGHECPMTFELVEQLVR